MVYGRFDWKIRFESESDGRFDSRFDSNEKNDSQVPTYNTIIVMIKTTSFSSVKVNNDGGALSQTAQARFVACQTVVGRGYDSIRWFMILGKMFLICISRQH